MFRILLGILSMLLGLSVVMPSLLSAQTTVRTTPGTASCKTLKTNVQGVANAPMTITNGATVVVMAASGTRCAGVVSVRVGTGAVNCAPDVTPTTTATGKGAEIAAGGSFSFGLEGQEALSCIAQSATNAVVDVREARP